MTQGVAPRALHEGLACYLEREIPRPASRRDFERDFHEDLASFLDRTERKRGRYSRHERLTTAVEEFRTEGSGQAPTVFTTYVGNELFVEYLVKQRGMGGIQSVLKTMASSKSVDAAFEEVYGDSYDGTRRAWLDWLRGHWGVGNPRR